MQPIRTIISGSNRASAKGLEVKHTAPVLELCRHLLASGVDSATPLHAYRGDMLCLKVRSIGEGAELRVEDDDRTGLRLRRWRPFPGRR